MGSPCLLRPFGPLSVKVYYSGYMTRSWSKKIKTLKRERREYKLARPAWSVHHKVGNKYLITQKHRCGVNLPVAFNTRSWTNRRKHWNKTIEKGYFIFNHRKYCYPAPAGQSILGCYHLSEKIPPYTEKNIVDDGWDMIPFF